LIVAKSYPDDAIDMDANISDAILSFGQDLFDYGFQNQDDSAVYEQSQGTNVLPGIHASNDGQLPHFGSGHIMAGSELAESTTNPPLMPPPPARTRKRKAPTLKADKWEPVKARIIELHITQKQTISQVMAEVKDEFGFEATYMFSSS
jgi:Clr5 domain